MNRRTRRTLLIVAAVLLLLAVAVFLRSKAPPEAARLLPESDGIIYVNLRPIRAFMPKNAKPPQRVAEYQEFVDATGIDWERDLDQVAIALHRMPDPNGPNGPVAYSMVLVGRLTGNKLNTWLESHATSREAYAGKTIYNIPSEGRTVRVAQIGYDMLAITNTPTPEQIHSIIDRHRAAALPFAGSSLLEQHYHDVPLLAFAWGVGQIGLPFSRAAPSASWPRAAACRPTPPSWPACRRFCRLPKRFISRGCFACAWKRSPKTSPSPPARPRRSAVWSRCSSTSPCRWPTRRSTRDLSRWSRRQRSPSIASGW